ncbi:DUF1003 domain-containing protein [Streptosporangiaceae bacterium NEAU-GS5]|nr:DUF1003 domain-containing protein [Streptosporangiaceae bacterium NEAU-GS5]
MDPSPEPPPPVSTIMIKHEKIQELHKRRGLQDRIADRVTAFSGSVPFIYIHIIWFTVWIVINSVKAWAFDPFPFGLLTLIVSLEAIFLSTFVMLSQNREALRSEVRSQIDFETNILSEVWLEALAAKLGVEVAEVHVAAAERIQAAKARQDQATG